MVIMKNWYITVDNPFVAPECQIPLLSGNVYGHSRFKDGSGVTTSDIKDVINCGEYKIVKTRNTEYVVYPNDVSEEYEKTYPNAYERLSIIKDN
jgi:hypothetical protein